MVLYGLFCYNDCNRIGRNAYYKINDKGRLRNERWGILSLRRLFMDQKEVSQNQTKYIQFRLSEEQYNKLKISGETYGLSPNLYAKKLAWACSARTAITNVGAIRSRIGLPPFAFLS